MKAIQLVFLGLLCVIASFSASWIFSSYQEKSHINLQNQTPQVAGTGIYPQAGQMNANWVSSLLSIPSSGNFVLAAKVATPAVVYIETISSEEDGLFFIPNRGGTTGSGVLISPDGYIVTNNHVVESASKIQVLLNNNREYSAELIGSDPTTDLALIKIEDSGLPFLNYGNSDSSLVGEWVLAVGNPLRLQSTVTAGIISAKARNINILNNQQYRIESFIQTDAAVNPGNSGGALVNQKGELIGINTAILSQTGRYEGYSFSIPSNLVKKVIYDIKDFGSVQRGLLGVVIEEVNSERAKLYSLSDVGGVFISSTTKDGAADAAGLKAEDIILKIDHKNIKSVPELQEIIGRLRPGALVNITYWRNNSKHETTATLKNQVNTTALVSTRRDPILLDLGFELRDLTDDEQRKLKTTGVKVLSIYAGSIIEATNMAPNYIITSLNGNKINHVNDLLAELKKAKKNVLLEGFYEKYKGKYPYRFDKY